LLRHVLSHLRRTREQSIRLTAKRSRGHAAFAARASTLALRKAACKLQQVLRTEEEAKAKAEREANKAAKKGSKNAAVACAEAVSSGAATSSAPPAEVVEELAVIEGEIYDALESDLGMDDPLHDQKESFKRLRNELKVKKIKAWMLDDGPSTPFLDWVLMKWPDLHEQALNAAMVEHGLDNESA
jgi:hypothetical protein